jgi:hypothetical protein
MITSLATAWPADAGAAGDGAAGDPGALEEPVTDLPGWAVPASGLAAGAGAPPVFAADDFAAGLPTAVVRARVTFGFGGTGGAASSAGWSLSGRSVIAASLARRALERECRRPDRATSAILRGTHGPQTHRHTGSPDRV